MISTKGSGRKLPRKALGWIGYGVLIALWICMLLAQLFPGLGVGVDDHVVRMGVLAALLAFLYYFDTRISRNEEVAGLGASIFDTLAQLKSDVVREVTEHGASIAEALANQKPEIVHGATIAHLFEAAMPDSNHVEKLRIFALNSDKIFNAFDENIKRYRADEVLLLLQSSAHSEYNLKAWEQLIPDRIKKFDSVFYDSLPNSYFVIFDRDCMILGGYYPDDRPSGAYYKPPFMIRDGRVIDTYIDIHQRTMDFYRKRRTSD